MKEWFLFTKKNYGLLIFWIKQKNKSTIIPNGIENLYHSNFLVQEGIRESKQLSQILTEQIRKNIILWHNLERLCNIKFNLSFKCI